MTKNARLVIVGTRSALLAGMLALVANAARADSRDAAGESSTEWIWTHAPQSWGVFVLLGALVAVAGFVAAVYRRDAATTSTGTRVLLMTLRLAALACVVLVLLGPARVEIERRTILPPLAVLRDASQSMATTDRFADTDLNEQARRLTGAAGDSAAGPVSRAALVERLLTREDRQLTRELERRGVLRTIDFADRTRIAEQDQLTADGRATDLSLAIREALAPPLPAAVVLFTDGQHTGRDDPREVARQARQLGVPLLIVGMGDPARPRNQQVVHIDARPKVWKDEPFEIETLIAAQGLEPSDSLTLEILEQRLAANGELSSPTVVARQPLPFPADGGQTRQVISHSRAEPGRFVYTARLTELSGERLTDDNQRSSTPVQVLDRESVRVLLVAGSPTWDYQLLERLLSRDRTMTVSCWLQSLDEDRAQAGTNPIGRLPTTREELFAYDAVVLLDPDPRELDAEWMELLKQFVADHAGGVLFMAGPQFSGRTLTMERAGALRDLLPVRLAEAKVVELGTLPTSQPRAWPMQIVAGNSDHPLLRLGNSATGSGTVWDKLPGIYWSFPALEPKPTANLLIEHGDPSLRSSSGARPLLVAGRFGAGHTLYLGFHSAWRWRSQGRQAEFYDRFWVQAIRYLVEGRALEGRRRGTLRVDRDRYELGEKVTLAGRLQGERYEPLETPQVEVPFEVAGQSAGTVTLRAIAGQPGEYEGTLFAKQLGRHVARLEFPPDETGEPVRLETSFVVEAPAREMAAPWLNEPLLRDLAQLSNGRYWRWNEVGQLAESVPDQREEVELRRPPEPLWDRGWLLALVVGLLATEWGVRKWRRLL